MNRAILLYSGGIDSTYLLYEMLMDDVGSGKRKMRNPVDEVLCLSFNYGQSHADRELGAAKRITDMLGVEHLFVTLDFPFLRQDLVGGDPVVPNRNMIFISVAGAIAKIRGFNLVFIGCTKSDYGVFLDCRLPFLRGIDDALVGSVGVNLVAPLVEMQKAEVVRIGREKHGIDWEDTWSCYAGGDEPCGECLACRERSVCMD